MLIGKFVIRSGESFIEDSNTLLARCEEAGDPFQKATQFLDIRCGLSPGQIIQVTGSSETIEGRAAFCVTGAIKASGRSAALAVSSMKRAAAL